MSKKNIINSFIKNKYENLSQKIQNYLKVKEKNQNTLNNVSKPQEVDHVTHPSIKNIKEKDINKTKSKIEEKLLNPQNTLSFRKKKSKI